MTVPVPERTRVLGQILHHVADQVVEAGIFYQPFTIAMANRVAKVRPGPGRTGWNSHDWYLRG